MARVLLADDEEALRLLMARQLKRSGHDVTEAEDGLKAVALLDSEPFDLVISDMKMPRLDGMGLLARATEIAPDTEFIILTGHGSMENAVDAFKTGRVFDYLLKPLEDIRELDAVVSRALERRQLRAENLRLVSELERQIDELESAKRQLALLAEHDGLTGLLNHRAIHQRLEETVNNRQHETDSLILIDLDDFKLINDTWGHPAGDAVLKHVATALESTNAGDAFLGRCGGDEFMIVIPDASSDSALSQVDRIKEYLSDHPFETSDGTRLPLAVCFGVAETGTAGPNHASLVAAADAALYDGKRNGGNRVTLHTHGTDEYRDSKSKFDVLDGIVAAIDMKDQYTRRHSEDVTEYATQLVIALGLSEETQNAVRVAGLLHDVGKIGIPESILRKPGKLTAEEYEIMKGHAALSTLIINGLPRLPDILDAVAHHHERWDGNGYPRGVKGEDIPLLGRVLAIADAYSAMTTDRPYRARMPEDVALIEIERHAGTQFDPELAAIFIADRQARLAQNRKAA